MWEAFERCALIVLGSDNAVGQARGAEIRERGWTEE